MPTSERPATPERSSYDAVNRAYLEKIKKLNPERQKSGVGPIELKDIYRSRESAARGMIVQHDTQDSDIKGVRHLAGDREDGGWVVRPYYAK